MDESLGKGLDADAAAWPAAVWARVRDAARRLAAARRVEALCALLLCALAANLLTAIPRKSITNDEVVHIPAGYYHLVAGEFQLNNEHPPLVKMWAALPLLFLQPTEPKWSQDSPENFMERTWSFHTRFWQSNRERFDALSFWPRVSMVPWALALGALVFVYARKLFGARAALFAVALYVLEPTVLAHGRAVHTDVPAALTFLLFFFTLHKYEDAPSWRWALWLGLATGLALVTKYSMIVLLPVLAVWALARFVRAPRLEGGRRARVVAHAVAVALVALLTVNAAYYFQSPPIEPLDVRWVELKSPGHSDAILSGMRALSNVVPTYFLFGLYNIVIHDQYGHATSLAGEHSLLGWWYYFPAAFALKTSLPFLLVSLAALALAVWQFITTRERRWLWALAPFAFFAAVCMRSHINIGVRHFLPAFPFLFIMGGALLDRVLRAGRLRRAGLALVFVLLAWTGLEALRAYPDYTPYMNQLAAGRPRWHYLSDSNVEWGDDVGELAEYLKARGERRVRAALLGGWSTLGFYGVEYVSAFNDVGVEIPETRYVALGASFLNGSTVPSGDPGSGRETEEGRVNYFAAYRDRAPEAVFGGSIYLYRVKE